jgi:hypothetical protein
MAQMLVFFFKWYIKRGRQRDAEALESNREAIQ